MERSQPGGITPRPRRRLKRWGKPLLPIVVVSVLIGCFYVFENWRWERDWQSYVSQKQQAGQWLDGSEPMPPAAENFAMIPMLQSLVGPQTGSNSGSLVLEGLKVPPFYLWRTNDNPGIIRPFHGNRYELNPINLLAFQTYYRGGTNFPPGQIHKGSMKDYLAKLSSGETGANVIFPSSATQQSAAADVLLALSIYDDAIDQMKAALDRPYARFHINLDPEGLTLRHLSLSKVIAYCLNTRAMAHMENGSPELALTDLLNGYRINLRLTEEPLLIGLLVRRACLEIHHHALWEGLWHRGWNADQLSRAQALLSEIDFFAHFSQCLRAEQAMTGKTLALMERERKPLKESDHSQPDQTYEKRYNRFMRWAPAGWFSYGSLRTADLLDLTAKAATSNPTVIDAPAVLDQLSPGEIPPFGRGFLVGHSNMGRHWTRICRAQTELNQAIIACALERSQLKHGRYPEKLDELIPEFLPAVLVDHADGNPMRYRKADDGRYRIYSIGDDGVDENGFVSPDKLGNEWVWRYSREQFE